MLDAARASCIPRRFVVIGLCFVGMFLGRALKTNLDYTLNMTPYADDVRRPDAAVDELKWDETMMLYLSAMYFIGFLATQLIAGYLSIKMPSHFLLGMGMFGVCVFNLLIPCAIMQGWYVLTCLCRALMGMAEGFLLPAYYGTLWRWTHRHERGRLGSMVISGYFLGSLMGFPLSGILTAYSIWQAPYLIFSSMGLCWVIVWAFWGNERPETDPNISDTELEHLREESRYDIYSGRKLTIPWRQILTSKHVLVLVLCNFTFYLCYTNEPHYVRAFGFSFSYYYRVLCACLPQMALVVIAHIGGFISDALIRSNRLSITVVRRIFTCSGFGVTSFCFLLLTFITEPTAILTILIIGIGFSGLTTSGWSINHLDLAPKFCGLLVGLSGSFGALSSLLCLLIAAIAPTDIRASRSFFPIVALTTGLAAVLYGLLGSGEVQSWCDDSSKRQQKLAVVLPRMTPLVSSSSEEGVPVQVFYKEWPFYSGGKQPDEDSGNEDDESYDEDEEYDDTQALLDMCSSTEVP